MQRIDGIEGIGCCGGIFCRGSMPRIDGIEGIGRGG